MMEGMTNVRARQKTHKENDRQRENVHTGGGKSQAMLKVKPTLHSDLRKGRITTTTTKTKYGQRNV